MVSALVLASALAGCGTGARTSQDISRHQNIPQSESYKLAPGDTLQISVYGEEELGGEYKLDSDGALSFPLIGAVKAGGLNADQLEEKIALELARGYLVDPSVTAQIKDQRPFYILGEVHRPGSYRFIENMTVLNAIAIAGGFTYRADKDDITITDKSAEGRTEREVSGETHIQPGDIIHVPERFF